MFNYMSSVMVVLGVMTRLKFVSCMGRDMVWVRLRVYVSLMILFKSKCRPRDLEGCVY